jgi:hypothetical protein
LREDSLPISSSEVRLPTGKASWRGFRWSRPYRSGPGSGVAPKGEICRAHE